MQLTALSKGQTLFHSGQVPVNFYFPVGAIVSMVIDHASGESVEAYTMGSASLVGAGAFGMPSFYRATVRTRGLAYQIGAPSLQLALGQCPTFRSRLQDEMARMLMRMSQSILCNRKHPLEQQIIRWILITLDRTTDRHIALTHAELAELLGVRREGVTLVLGRLTDRGWIQNERGAITVLDRPGLESMACECYWAGENKAQGQSVNAWPQSRERTQAAMSWAERKAPA